jgi:hypothetical protein
MEIVRRHKFDNPRFVQDFDEDYALTLLVDPVDGPSLLDMGAIMN